MEAGRAGIALLTAAIETPLFYLCGYRDMADCLWFAVINIMSNLLLNGFLDAAPLEECFWGIMIAGELAVAAVEFALCRCLIPPRRAGGGLRLLLTVFWTNTASFLCGVAWAFLASAAEGPIVIQ
jgi:hypothetical protein